MRFLKNSESEATKSAAESVMDDGEQPDNDAMNEENYELELNRNESIFARRFDPEMMMPISLSRSVSMAQNPNLDLNYDKLQGMDLNAFYNEQKEWTQSRNNQFQSQNSGNSMMMEELPTQNHQRKHSDDYLELSPMLIKNNYSFLDLENMEKSIMQHAHTNNLNLGIEGYFNEQLPQFGGQSALKMETPIAQGKQVQYEIFSHNGDGGGYVPPEIFEGRPTCNCNKSQCLKLYCMCFRKGFSCQDRCRCINCMNTPKNHELLLNKRNQKILRQTETEEIFCNCRMSFCEKSYCVCARKGMGCSKLCNCFNCKNPKGSKKNN